jgi:hypothetical protein
MLKSLIIKLRRKPKVVREQLALTVAGIFTFVVFGIWAFSLPGQFANLGDQPAGSIVSSLGDDLADGPDLSDLSAPVSAEQREATGVETGAESTVVIPNEYPTTTPDASAGGTPIRLATTSTATTTEPQNSQ